MPTFATAHMLCASPDCPRKSGFLTVVPAKTEIFCAVYNYEGKAEFDKGYWNPKRKIGVTMYFFFRDYQASIWEKVHILFCHFLELLNYL